MPCSARASHQEAVLVSEGGSGLLAGPGRVGAEAEPVGTRAAHLFPEEGLGSCRASHIPWSFWYLLSTGYRVEFKFQAFQ